MTQPEIQIIPLDDADARAVSETVQSLGGVVPDDALDLLARYRAEIIRWSRRLNLVSRRDEERIVPAHVVDSFRPLSHLPAAEGAWIADLGSGAGFPGIPLKIIRRDLRMTLIESSEKRRVFLAHLCRELGLRRTEAVPTRAEDLAHDTAYAGKLDAVLARASGRLEALMRWSGPLLREEGAIIAYKPSESEEEIREASETARELGFSAPEILPEPGFPWKRGVLVRVRRSTSSPMIANR